MAFRIDDDENRFQDIKDQIDQLEIQTFSPEVVARNESTRNTGVQTGDAAATNAYPQWMPIRDFGSVGNLTLDIVLNRTDSHVAKLTAIGDIDFAFSLPPGTNKMMEFILDVTIDGIGGYTLNLLNNTVPSGISIDNSPDTRTVIRFTTTDAGVTYYAEDISSAATGGGNVPDGTAQFQHLEWSGSAWIAQQALAFGVMSADVGQLRFTNDSIGLAWRNLANNGNIEIKVNASDFVDITNSANDTVGLFLRAQSATNPDASMSITQTPDVGAGVSTTNFTYPNELAINHGATLVALFTSDDTTKFFGDVDINGNALFLNSTTNAVIAAFGTDIQFFTNNLSRVVLTDTEMLMGVDIDFDTLSADSGKINFPNNTIGVAWRNATNDGNLELKATIAGNLDITRSDNTAISLSIRSQNAIEADQFLSLSVGSGAAINVDAIIDTSAGKLKFAVGGANRLTIDVTANTSMILKSPSGITAQSFFDVVSTHVTEADQNIGIFVGSGDAADAVLTTSANIFKLAVDNTVRWELDVNIGNEITQTAFGINPLYDFFNDDSTPNDFDLLGRINFSGRNSNSDKIIYGGIFVESTDVTDNTEDATMFFSIITAGIILPKLTLQSDGMVLADGSIRLDEISAPSNPPANTGLIYLRDVGTITIPFFKDSAGTETSLIGGGNQISQLDSNVTVTDSGTGIINFVTDSLLQGSIQNSLGWTFNNNMILGTTISELIQGAGGVARDWNPNVGGIRVMGSTSLNWSTLFVGRTNYVTGATLSGRMFVDASGVEIEAILSGDFIELKTQASVRANFKAEADGGITFFEPLEVNDNIRIDGGNMIHAHDSIECGFAVTDDITSPGSFGTMQMPVNTGNATNAADADGDFGAAVGCYGIYLSGQGVGTPLYVIKIDDSPSTWAILLLNAAGNVSAGRLT